MIIVSKPISADDLALFGAEVSWRRGKSDQLFISFGDIIEERAAEGFQWMQLGVFFLIMNAARWTDLKHGEIPFCLD